MASAVDTLIYKVTELVAKQTNVPFFNVNYPFRYYPFEHYIWDTTNNIEIEIYCELSLEQELSFDERVAKRTLYLANLRGLLNQAGFVVDVGTNSEKLTARYGTGLRVRISN